MEGPYRALQLGARLYRWLEQLRARRKAAAATRQLLPASSLFIADGGSF
jgi:hypothetical protein